MVDNSLPWDMAVQQGEELPQIVRVAMEEESLKKDIIQKGQSFADRMKMILGVFPSKKWTLEEGECQIDVLPDGTYRFEFPHGPNPSRCAWLQIGSDIVE